MTDINTIEEFFSAVLTPKEDMSWLKRGACKGSDTNLFFPTGNSFKNVLIAKKARAVCATCSVMHECRDYAMRHTEEDGIWGGTTLKERQIMRGVVVSMQKGEKS